MVNIDSRNTSGGRTKRPRQKEHKELAAIVHSENVERRNFPITTSDNRKPKSNFFIRNCENITMRNNKQSEATTAKPTSRIGWLSTMFAIASRASAFQSARELHVSVPTAPPLRSSATGSYGNDIFMSERRSSAVSTRLQYSDGSDESTSSSPLKWLNTILPSQRNEDNEQESVDEYLEFLDRRYRRLHSKEDEESKKSFSALDWLKQGSPSRHDLVASKQQKEDALYVLGVAGLASQKLLQRHHRLVEDQEVDARQVSRTTTTMEVMDADIVQVGPVSSLIKTIVVPFVRFLYVAQHRKDIFFKSQLQRLSRSSRSAVRMVARALVYGPMATAKAVLEVGGGKKTLAVTFAAAGTILLLLRPVIQAMLTEGTVNP